MADHIVFALAWNITQRDGLHAHEHTWGPVENLQPGGQLIYRDQRDQKAIGTEYTEARARLRVGETTTGICLVLHDDERKSLMDASI